MKLKTLQFITIMLVALSMSMAFCHLLEMPIRLGYAPTLWSQVTNIEGTYQYFGPPVGAILEGGAWIAAVLLAVLSRKRDRPIFFLTLAAAICMILTQAVFWTFVMPVNNQMLGWSPDSLPPDFATWRNQWEYAHAARALLQIIGLGALVASLLVAPVPRPGSAKSSA